jgi:hypothetical protein
MAFSISVPYTIVVDSGVVSTGIHEGAPREGPWAEVKFRCYWNDRYQLCSDLLGTWIVAGTTVIRTPAFLYPAAPQLFCTDIMDITPMGKPIVPRFLFLPWVSRQLATVTARFTIPGYTQDGSDQSAQAFTRVSMSTTGEFLTLPQTTYRFADSTPTFTPVGFMIPQITFTWQRFKLPIIPAVAMAAMCGKVNSDSFKLTRDFTAAPGTVLFMPGDVQPDGNVQAMFVFEYGYPFSYTANYIFMWKPIPWNYFLHPDRTSGFQVVTDGSGNPPYQPVPFTNQFP